MRTVLATREGLPGGLTAPSLSIRVDGNWIRRRGIYIDEDEIPFTLDDMFVALPSRRALGLWVRVAYMNVTVTVPVLDLGPWFPFADHPSDDDYVFGCARPRAEFLKGTIRHGDRNKFKINGAGIDLGDGVIKTFRVQPSQWGMRGVAWEFLNPVLERDRSCRKEKA